MTSNIETEYKDITSKNAWPVFFSHIRSESSKYNYKCLESLKPQNKNLNRYRDVSPYDHSRIILQRGSCDYINANLVKIDRANRKYILTQGPLAETVPQFWLMVWEQKSRAVLMLNKIVEKKQVKCHWYWPQAPGPEHAIRMEDVGLIVEYVQHEDCNYYSKRIFRLTDIETMETRTIQQFHYTTWPDFGVPSSPTAFLEFLRVVRESDSLEDTVGPAVIHCSAGIGRSGTFCLVDSCLIIIEKEGLNSVNVKDILLEMRKYRMGLIQTPDQLRFSYQAIIEGAKQLSNCNDINNCNPPSDLSEYIDLPGTDEDEPPPLPPPRTESLTRSYHEQSITERPLPKIPNSASLGDIAYREINSSIGQDDEEVDPADSPDEKDIEEEDEEIVEVMKRPLPVVPSEREESEEEEPVENNIANNTDRIPSPSELRQRKRLERKEQMSAQVREMKRKQLSAEQWAQFKRSLYKPVLIGVGVLVVGGGVLAYAYFKP